jgi:transaldolase
MNSSLLDVHQRLIDEYMADEPTESADVGPNDRWQTLREEGSELWLDTGSLSRASESWTAEFSGLTTNNALLNDEIQGGEYDDVVQWMADELRNHVNSERELVHELTFLLNALHGTRLVNRFGCRVSVELHTDFARDVERTVEYGRRFHEIQPDHFIIKVPFTAEGVVAARQLRGENIPVNQTVAFSVRQNYVIGRLSRASYGNVFMGRLNSLFEENNLPDVKRIGEKIALASHKTLAFLRKNHDSPTRQIAASFRSGDQVMNLGGVDVLTMPPEVAEQYLELVEENQTTGRLRLRGLLDEAEEKPGTILTRLATVEDSVREAVDEWLESNDRPWDPEALRDHFESAGVTDLFPRWSEDQIERSRKEGKIPDLSNWETELNEERVALDSLMSLAGLNAFAEAQSRMDRRVREKIQ